LNARPQEVGDFLGEFEPGLQILVDPLAQEDQTPERD
jgi:hypothetical protein